MKIAACILLAAAAFCAASITGAVPFRSSRPPPAIVLPSSSNASLHAVTETPRRAAVRREVEQTRQTRYRARAKAAP
jgi:hypothetical protein